MTGTTHHNYSISDGAELSTASRFCVSLRERWLNRLVVLIGFGHQHHNVNKSVSFLPTCQRSNLAGRTLTDSRGQTERTHKILAWRPRKIEGWSCLLPANIWPSDTRVFRHLPSMCYGGDLKSDQHRRSWSWSVSVVKFRRWMDLRTFMRSNMNLELRHDQTQFRIAAAG